MTGEAACVLAVDCANTSLLYWPEGSNVTSYHLPYVKYGDGLKPFKYYVYR